MPVCVWASMVAKKRKPKKLGAPPAQHRNTASTTPLQRIVRRAGDAAVLERLGLSLPSVLNQLGRVALRDQGANHRANGLGFIFGRNHDQQTLLLG